MRAFARTTAIGFSRRNVLEGFPVQARASVTATLPFGLSCVNSFARSENLLHDQ